MLYGWISNCIVIVLCFYQKKILGLSLAKTEALMYKNKAMKNWYLNGECDSYIYFTIFLQTYFRKWSILHFYLNLLVLLYNPDKYAHSLTTLLFKFYKSLKSLLICWISKKKFPSSSKTRFLSIDFIFYIYLCTWVFTQQ